MFVKCRRTIFLDDALLEDEAFEEFADRQNVDEEQDENDKGHSVDDSIIQWKKA